MLQYRHIRIKKRTLKAAKFQKAIVGMSLDDIKKKKARGPATNTSIVLSLSLCMYVYIYIYICIHYLCLSLSLYIYIHTRTLNKYVKQANQHKKA